jgi:hypothetical protein
MTTDSSSLQKWKPNPSLLLLQLPLLLLLLLAAYLCK